MCCTKNCASVLEPYSAESRTAYEQCLSFGVRMEFRCRTNGIEQKSRRGTTRRRHHNKVLPTKRRANMSVPGKVDRTQARNSPCPFYSRRHCDRARRRIIETKFVERYFVVSPHLIVNCVLNDLWILFIINISIGMTVCVCRLPGNKCHKYGNASHCISHRAATICDCLVRQSAGQLGLSSTPMKAALSCAQHNRLTSCTHKAV